MTSRLLPLTLAACAAAADASGRHSLASVLVLLAIPCAAGAAFVGVGDALNGRDLLRGVTTALALVLLVLGSTVRAHAAVGAAVPAFALSATIGAIVIYALPLVGWVLEPLKPRPRTRPAARIRTSP
jgi:hypothetical protein